jgi:hypothetical protein
MRIAFEVQDGGMMGECGPGKRKQKDNKGCQRVNKAIAGKLCGLMKR